MDVAVGAAIRVPVGELRSNDDGVSADAKRALALGAAGGVSPGAQARIGLGDAVDLGVRVVGTTAGIDLRYAVVLDDARAMRLITGIGPYGGLIADRDEGSGWRAGVEVPVIFGWELGGLYELWVGARVAGERIHADAPELGAATRTLDGWHWRAGGVLGVGVGFRRLFAFVELAADYEWLVATLGDADADASGLSLTPSFGLRWRF